MTATGKLPKSNSLWPGGSAAFMSVTICLLKNAAICPARVSPALSTSVAVLLVSGMPLAGRLFQATPIRTTPPVALVPSRVIIVPVFCAAMQRHGVQAAALIGDRGRTEGAARAVGNQVRARGWPCRR